MPYELVYPNDVYLTDGLLGMLNQMVSDAAFATFCHLRGSQTEKNPQVRQYALDLAHQKARRVERICECRALLIDQRW